MPASVSLDGTNPAQFRGSLLAIPLGDGPTLTAQLAELDTSLSAAMQRAIDARDFRGARDEVFHLSGTANGARRVMLLGMGKITDRAGSLRRAAAIAAR